MVTRRNITILLSLIIAGLIIIFIGIWIKRNEGEKMNINIEGFEIEYTLTSKKITMDEISDIELGSSINEIRDELGEPDEWIGSGMLRPVYFLEDNKVVVFHFNYPAVCDDLRQIVLININGDSQIIKEK